MLEDVLIAARRFATGTIASHAEHWESLGRVPYDAFEAAGDAGLCGLLAPTDHGGQGLSVGDVAQVCEVLASGCMSAAFSFVVHNNLVGHIANFGTVDQIRRFVPDMIQGRRIGAFLLTEPGVGSDAQAITTTAERVQDGWLLNGDKAWVSNGRFADVLSVYAQTDAGSGGRGIACFLVDAESDGVKRGDSYPLLRGHALGTGGFSFNQCFVPDANILRPAGEAFKAAMYGINAARIYIAAMCCGILRESLRHAVHYADRRVAFGRSTLELQGVQWLLADAATDLEAAAGLTVRARELADGTGDPTIAAAHAKKFASRVAFTRIADCMQAMGAAGYSADYPLVRHLAAAKMAQIVDGTSEIQNVVIARALVSDYVDASA